MPIRAHAVGGRVSPHLGPRPLAWLHDRAGIHRSRGRRDGPQGGGIARDAPALCSPAGLRMTLPRSPARQAYRIYSEEEFFAAEDWQAEAELALCGQGDPQRESRQWGRFAALAALASVVAVVVGVVALNATRSGSGSDRRSADVGIAQLRTRARLPRRRPRQHTRRASMSARRVAERRPGAAGRLPIPAHPYLPPQPPPAAEMPAPVPAGAVTVSAKATAGTGTAGTGTVGGGTAGTGTVGVGTAGTGTAGTAMAGTATARTATAAVGGARSEFGFERR